MTEWRGGERERQSEMEKDLNERVGKGRMGKENEPDNGREGKEKKSGLRKKKERCMQGSRGSKLHGRSLSRAAVAPLWLKIESI